MAFLLPWHGALAAVAGALALLACGDGFAPLSFGGSGGSAAGGGSSSTGGAGGSALAGGSSATGGAGGATATGGSGGATGECVEAADCPVPEGSCSAPTCDQGSCGTEPLPEGTPLPADKQTGGDCKLAVCDGKGDSKLAWDDLDLPNDGYQCTADGCKDGQPQSEPKPKGTGCNEGGGKYCDGKTDCVECIHPAHCGLATECAQPDCVNYACNPGYQPKGTPLKEQAAGDCKTAICDGSGGKSSTADVNDKPLDPNGSDCVAYTCVGSTPTTYYLQPGTMCKTADGAGTCCGNGVCCNGMCTNNNLCVEIM